jgi:hypothetical protein
VNRPLRLSAVCYIYTIRRHSKDKTRYERIQAKLSARGETEDKS